MAHEADEGRAPDDVGGGGGAQQSVEGGEALGRSGPPRRTAVTIASWPPETRVAPLLVRQVDLFLGGEAPIVSRRAKAPTVEAAAHTQGPTERSIGRPAWFEGEGRRPECEFSLPTSARSLCRGVVGGHPFSCIAFDHQSGPGGRHQRLAGSSRAVGVFSSG